jgi:MFS family permease
MGSGGSKPSMRKALEVFQNRHYRVLWASTLFSFTGMGMQHVARGLLAWQLTEDYGKTGMVAASFGFPMLLFALVGGALADRLEKRNLTLMTQGSTAILMLATALMITTDVMTFEILFAVGLAQGTFFALGMPARTPLMAEAVGPDKLMSAIAMSNAAMNLTRLLGPAMVGGILLVSGIDAVYYTQSGLYVVSFLLMFLVPTGLAAVHRARVEAAGGGPGMGARPQGSMVREIGLGIAYAWGHPRLRLLLGMMFLITMVGMPHMMLLPGFVQEDLGQSESAFALLQIVAGAGGLVASLGVAAFTEFDRKPLVQWIAGVSGGLGLIALGFGSLAFGFPGAMAAVLFVGLAFTGYQTLNNTMLMSEADPEYYGRVMSLMMMTFSGMSLVAAPLGMLADAIGAAETFALEGGVIIAVMLLVGITRRAYTFGRDVPTTHAQRQAADADAVAGGGGG